MTLTADDARHLLRRTGYGASASAVATFTGVPRDVAVDQLTRTDGGHGPERVPASDGTGTTARRNLAHWWVRAMTYTTAPIVEHLFYFWHSHFACTADRVRDFRSMRDQHVTIRRYGLGGFHDLCQAIAVDPAMLIDLDNASNRAGDEQENFARELMELYTIGNGKFTEDEVVSVARAWTGHNLADDSRPPRYEFHSDRHDKHDKILFGITRKWDGPDTITELVEGVRRDDTARFLATKLWRSFGDPTSISPTLQDHLTDAMKAADMSALATVRAILRHDDFWAPERRLSIVKDPITWIVELQRRTNVHLSASRLDQRCEHLNQQLFRPPSVAGWGHNGAWLSSPQLLTRNRVALDMARDVANRGFMAGIADMNADAAAQFVLDRFGIPDASPGTREAVARWHRDASDDLSDSWMEREAFRVGAMLPEVNLR